MIDWEGIVDRDGPSAWRTAWRVLGNRADADECFQEALMAAVEYSRTRPVKHWRALLQRLAAARAIDRLRQRVRRRDRERPLEPDGHADPSRAPSARAEDAELAARLRSALGRLPPDHAQAFWLFYREGLTYVEIAESMGVSGDLVGMWLQRARRRLRDLLAAPEPAREVSP